MVFDVSDVRSNAPEQLTHAVNLIKGRAKQRRDIFAAIYRGKKKFKTVSELENIIPRGFAINHRRIRVLQEGGILAANFIVESFKDKKTGETAYRKIDFYSKNYKKILDLAINPQKLERIATKRNPINIRGNIEKIYIPRSRKFAIKQLTIEDIDSFKLNQKSVSLSKPVMGLSEKIIKLSFQKIIGEKGSFKDWSGENSDLFTTKLRLRGKRFYTAIAFKGKATKGKLTPEKMGKRGTQIMRLFEEPAQVFLIVYCGQIDPSIISQMHALAVNKSIATGQKIYYGIIDSDDLGKLINAYPGYFINR